jgi:hypothetical protein
LQLSFFLTGVEEEEEDEDEEDEEEKVKERGSFLGCSRFFWNFFFGSYRSLEVFALPVFLFGGLSSVVVEFVGLDPVVLLTELFLFVVS